MRDVVSLGQFIVRARVIVLRINGNVMEYVVVEKGDILLGLMYQVIILTFMAKQLQMMHTAPKHSWVKL